ncbi:MAG TPA: hypothetical protein VGX92_17870 [Pyrinomonadaceae bacterium]|jgi:hypothetical protein|nr:hypothetical protein [Pyrinomonadaceae bacterium]
MWRTSLYIIACAVAALIPVLSTQNRYRGAETSRAAFPGWPTRFEGRALTQLQLTPREERFGRDFPGRIARFTDGKREVIIRWVTEATRKLHPASDCFQGIGYGIKPAALRVDEAGQRWASFTATRGSERLRVYERIYADGGGGAGDNSSWPDVSAWYWSAVGEGTAGPWWAVTVAEKEPEGDALNKESEAMP